jgi:hypothetical protein
LYENKSEPLAPLPVFYRRVFRSLAFAGAILGVFLAIGTLGYHYTDNADWLDSFHNASMILSGMGPVIQISSTSGKIFSSLYALVSGVAFITNIGIILTPLAHRLFHHLHLDDDDDDN